MQALFPVPVFCIPFPWDSRSWCNFLHIRSCAFLVIEVCVLVWSFIPGSSSNVFLFTNCCSTWMQWKLKNPFVLLCTWKEPIANSFLIQDKSGHQTVSPHSGAYEWWVHPVILTGQLAKTHEELFFQAPQLCLPSAWLAPTVWKTRLALS